MTRAGRSALVTVRVGDSVTAIHDPGIAARWVESLAQACRHKESGLECLTQASSARALPLFQCVTNQCPASMLQATAAADIDGDATSCPETCACSLSQCKAAVDDRMGDAECAKQQRCAFPTGGGGSGAPIPEAAHSLGPGQVPKLPPPATSRTAGALQAAGRESFIVASVQNGC